VYGLLRYLLIRFAPRVGWPLALLALAAAWSPSLAASSSTLALSESIVFWAGLGGVLLGLRAGRGGALARAALGVSAVGLGALLVIAGGRALPPASLVFGDLAALVQASVSWWRGVPLDALPELRALRFLAASVPRLWQQLLAAPGAGESGAALIVTTFSVVSTWAGALCLGWATGAGRRTLGWSLPLLAALASTTILGGASGIALLIGVGLLLVLAIASSYAARERAWERSGAAYAEDLRWDVLGWGALTGGAALLLALALPTSLPSSLAGLFWPAGELPSGLAEIDSRVQRGPASQTARVGLSELPAVQLGVSLEQGPPETLALRVRTGAPLPPGPWPRYWRARLLTRYDSRSWWAEARTSSFGPPLSSENLPPGAVVQQVEDLRARRSVLVALPDVLWLDVPAGAERLPDGMLTALTPLQPGTSYRAVSLPQELAASFDERTGALPDLSPYLRVPPSVPPRVAELAQSIAGQESTQLGRAIALERYLRALPYSYTVRPLPPNGDAVDQFLFEMREGYCTYYASAMALMARSLGIPARVAIGYASGAYDQASGTYVVREADAHAWPELLIGGRWLPFEPTPIRPLPARDADPPPTVVAAPSAPVAQPDRLPSPAALALIGVGVTVAIGVALWLLIQTWLRSPVTQAQLQIERLGARSGVRWPAGATLHEYARLVETRVGHESKGLRELVELIEGARYGRHPLNQLQTDRLRRIAAELKRWPRRRS
jgi:transglutaminase-like putative cysteine protease